jgi:hypothetical protein
MSFELSPTNDAKYGKVSDGNGLSLLVALLSPLIAVCLSQYLRTHEEHQTAVSLPVPSIDANLREVQCLRPRLEPAAAEDASKDQAQPWPAFSVQAEKQARAKKLLERANGANVDPADRWMMLRLAKDIAAEAHGGQTAFQAIDVMAEAFHVDAGPMKMAALTKFASAAKTPAQHKSIAERALKLANQAVAQDQFMVANQMGRLALSEAKKAADRELLAQVQSQISEAAEQLWAREHSSELSGSLATVHKEVNEK